MGSLSDAPPPPTDDQMAQDRLEFCMESATVGGGDSGDSGFLICSLLAGHDGFLHWDNTDRIWWCAR